MLHCLAVSHKTCPSTWSFHFPHPRINRVLEEGFLVSPSRPILWVCFQIYVQTWKLAEAEEIQGLGEQSQAHYNIAIRREDVEDSV